MTDASYLALAKSSDVKEAIPLQLTGEAKLLLTVHVVELGAVGADASFVESNPPVRLTCQMFTTFRL